MDKETKQVMFIGAVVTVILFLIDQLTKVFAKMYLAGTAGISVIPGVFELYYLENRGAAFGMLADRQWFFIVIAVIMTVMAVYVYVQTPNKNFYLPLRIICILIAAGAAGNMVDRMIWKYVIDFLYVSLIDFPVFNIADCYVCIGAALAVILLFTLYKDEPFDFLTKRTQ